MYPSEVEAPNPCPDCGAAFHYSEKVQREYSADPNDENDHPYFFDSTEEVWYCGRRSGMNSERELWDIPCQKEKEDLEFLMKFVKALVCEVDEMEGISEEDLLKAKKLVGV